MNMTVSQRTKIIRKWQNTNSGKVVKNMYNYVLEECEFGHAMPDQKIEDIEG